MSGSYDRPTGPPARTSLELDPYRDRTGPATVTHGRGTYDQTRTARPAAEERAPRSRRNEPGQTNAPIVPAGSVTGRSLTLVITIMCFLACLTAGAVYMMNQSASAWLRDIASEVTVQVEVKNRTDVDKFVARRHALPVAAAGHRLRASAHRGGLRAAARALARPDRCLSALPIPRIVAVELDRNNPPDFDQLRSALNREFKDVTLDDHRRWQAQIRTITRSFALGGLAILLLVGAATTAVIVSATKSAMASNRDIVEVLHFVGATDRFIAREFERHFLRLGVRAGIVGAIWAMFVFLIMPTVMELLGGGTVTITEIRRLIGTAALDPPGYFLLGIVVLVIAALCMLTSRIGVYRILNSQH